MISEQPTPDTGGHDLAGQLRRGIGWMLGSQFSTQILGFITSAVVARYLGPRQVGLAGMALVFASLAIVMADSGLGSAIVQRPVLTEDDKSTAFVASLVVGVALLLLGVGLSWPIAALFGEPKVQNLFAVMSLAFLFTAPGIVPEALLTRELRFRELQTRYIIAGILSCGATIAAAVAGAGAWALVIQVLVITGVSSALRWRISGFRPTRRLSWRSLRELTHFGGNVLGSDVTDWASQNVDNLLVGKVLHASALGAYSIAYNVAVVPVKRIAVPLAEVFFPAFSRMEDPRQIAATWLRAVRSLSVVVVPALLAMLVLAPDFVRLVFGPKWHAAVEVLQILTLVGLLQALARLGTVVLQAVGRVRLLFRFTAIASAITVGAFAVGLIWGLRGVAVAYLSVTIVLQPLFVVISCRVIGVSVLSWLDSVSGVFQAGAGMMLVLYAVREGLLSVPTLPRFLLSVIAAALSYVTLLWWRAPEVKRDLRGVRRGRLSGSPEPAPA